jgi:hypothetical protein
VGIVHPVVDARVIPRCLVQGAGCVASAVDEGIFRRDVAQLAVAAALEFSEANADVETRLVRAVDSAIVVVVEDAEKGLPGDLEA